MVLGTRYLLAAALAALCATSAAAGAPVIRKLSELNGKPYNVTYNSRSMMVGGKPVLLLSGSVHYVRSTPEVWPSIFAKMKAAGMNTVESYVFWNWHVPSLNRTKDPDYTGRGNVTLFLQLAAEADLFVIWRIGPYICAEWPGGGMPGWLRQVGPGMHPRSATEPYQDTCKSWMAQHIEVVRPFFATNGGPILMTQMENELSPSSKPAAKAYVAWLGELATQLNTGLPWIMCHGAHANDTIETCNGCDCASFVSGQAALDRPGMWSEDEQWFDRFTQGASVRGTGNVGRGVAAFVAAGGSMHNYYMFHGGTMWGNWSTTVRRTRLTPSYANTANLASDSIIYDPKYTTLANLHILLQKYAETLLHTPIAELTPPKKSTKPYFKTVKGTAGDDALTFAFNDGLNASQLTVGGKVYAMAAGSSRIFDSKLALQWYSQPTQIDGEGVPYSKAVAAPLKWRSWSNNGGGGGGARAAAGAGTWYGTSFALDASLPAAAQVSVNLTGFGQGNLFVNGVHVVYFNLADGSCAKPPGGVNGHGACLGYIQSRCGKPTQDCYHVAPEWLLKGAGAKNEMLVWSEAKLPANVTAIDPSEASVVFRQDPPQWRHVLSSSTA